MNKGRWVVEDTQPSLLYVSGGTHGLRLLESPKSESVSDREVYIPFYHLSSFRSRHRTLNLSSHRSVVEGWGQGYKRMCGIHGPVRVRELDSGYLRRRTHRPPLRSLHGTVQVKLTRIRLVLGTKYVCPSPPHPVSPSYYGSSLEIEPYPQDTGLGRRRVGRHPESLL